MSKTLSNNGYRVELREGKKRGDTYDVKINGIKADLKSISSVNNIRGYAKKATDKQGADVVIFELNKKGIHPNNEFNKLKKKGIQVYYYEKGKNKIQKF